MDSNHSARIRQKRANLPCYLAELENLLGREVAEGEIEPVELAIAMRQQAAELGDDPRRDFEISFDQLREPRFGAYVRELDRLLTSDVLIWTPRTIFCGPMKIASLGDVHWNFDFGVNSEGILSFSASDLSERLTLDFSADTSGSRIVRIEAIGKKWHAVAY